MRSAVSTKTLNAISIICLIGLVVFLPLSSWLVSLSGLVWVSSARDLFSLILLILAVFSLKNSKITPIIKIITVFLFWILISYFWREANSAQWLKGARFLVGPFLLFAALSSLTFSEIQKKWLKYVTLTMIAIIAALSLLDLFNHGLPLVSQFSGAGSLENSHYVGTLAVRRIQAVLAGPNALGLYLLASFAFLLSLARKNRWFYAAALLIAALIIFTFSRSCLIGLIATTLLFLFLQLHQRWGALKALAIWIPSIAIILAAGFWVYKSDTTGQYFTHNASSSLRYEQYQRIWQQKYEIGLLGRGVGTAGPSSQSRLDGGENHWTENTYLDIFEETGFVGLLIYLTLISYLICISFKRRDDFWTAAAFYGLFAFTVTGLFINYFTGQAGIWYLLIMTGMSLQKEKRI